MIVLQPTPKSRVTAVTDSPLRPPSSAARARARSVSDARCVIASEVSKQLTTVHCRRRRQIRLTQISVTSRPALGSGR